MIIDPAENPLMNLGLRDQIAAHVKASVRDLMIDIYSDQLLHATILGAGPFHFRQAFVKDMGPFFANHREPCAQLADVVFRFCEVQWRLKYPDLTPTQFLDHVQIATPPTEQEIEDAWELEIGSSESALKDQYEGSARTRKGADIFRFNRNKG